MGGGKLLDEIEVFMESQANELSSNKIIELSKFVPVWSLST